MVLCVSLFVFGPRRLSLTRSRCFSGVHGRSPHMDLPLVASVGALDDGERGHSEDEGSEDGRLYKEF
jgi:hypothetical protein